MEPTNIITALSLLLKLWDRFDDAFRQYRDLIEQAQAEGRDLTDEELDSLRMDSQAALEDWLDG